MREASAFAQPRLSVVIPVRNDAAGISRCLAGLARQSVELEIIVVDDGSSDETCIYAERWGATVLSSPRRGAAAARNLGLRSVHGEVVLFTDADCIPTPGWAKRLGDPILEGRAIATKGTYRSRQGSNTARFVQLEYEERYARMATYDAIDFLDTYSLAVRREDLLTIGGFDEAFAGASVEDQEMSFRLAPLGRFLFVPQAVVEHRHADSPGGYARKKFRIGRGKATVVRRHANRIHGDSHTPTSLRWQLPAVWCALAALCATILWPWMLLPAVALALAPVALSGELIRRSLVSEGVAFAFPTVLLTALRGWALSLGFLWGVFSPLAKISRHIDSSGGSPCESAEPAAKAQEPDVVHLTT